MQRVEQCDDHRDTAPLTTDDRTDSASYRVNNGVPAYIYIHLRADRGKVIVLEKWNGLYTCSDTGVADAALYACAQAQKYNCVRSHDFVQPAI